MINVNLSLLNEDGFKKHGYLHNNPAEHRAFVNSLPQLDGVFDRSFGVNQDLTVAKKCSYY